MSFRKPCHMPFRKLIPPFTRTEEVGGEHAMRNSWSKENTQTVEETTSPSKDSVFARHFAFTRIRKSFNKLVQSYYFFFFVFRGTLETFRLEDEKYPEYVIRLRVFSAYSQKADTPEIFIVLFLNRKINYHYWPSL